MIKYELITSIIKDYPHIKVLLILDKYEKEIISEFAKKVNSLEGELDLLIFSDKEMVDLKEDDFTLIHEVELFEKRSPKSKTYEYSFSFSKPCSSERLIKFYQILENSGELIQIFEDGGVDIWEEKDRIQEANFVAVNDTKLDENIIMLSAKKMHGWRSMF